MNNIQTNVIHCGDNLEIMRNMPDESVDLIYLDPPFFSGCNYDVIWEGVNGSDHSEIRSFKDTEWYRVQCPKCDREVVKADRFCSACGNSLDNAKVVSKNDIYAYIDWMVPRLKDMHRILKPTGSLYLHCDGHAVHYLKIEMDRIFDIKNYRNEIVWQRTDAHNNVKKKYGAIHDNILFYSKTSKYTFNVMSDRDKLSDAGLKEYSLIQLENGAIVKYRKGMVGRRVKLENATVPGVKGEDGKIKRQYEWRGAKPSPRRSWMVEKDVMEEMLADGRVHLRNKSKGAARCKVSYLDERNGIAPQDIWYNVGRMKGGIRYPTEKPERLLERIIKVSSTQDDIVLDPFCGCGTSTSVAKRLNRKYIGIDVSPTACTVIAERLHIPEWKIKGMPMTTDELIKMEPHEFQQWVCTRMEAKNTNPDPTKHGGADGGIDGIVKSNILTTGYAGALVQVKRSEDVGVNTIDKHFSVMTKPNNPHRNSKGFVVALSFGKGAIDQANEYNKAGEVEIILVKAEDIAENGYFQQ